MIKSGYQKQGGTREMKKKRLVAAAMAGVLAASVLVTGCGSKGGGESGGKGEKGGLSGTLTFAIWDNNLTYCATSNRLCENL